MKLLTFWNDKDGLSAKDYLLIISTFVFFLFITIGLVLVLFDKKIDEMYLSLLELVVPVVMTVVGGTMGVQAVESFVNRNKGTDTIEQPEKVTNENPYTEGGGMK